jgi:hypothetical protein
MMPLFPASLEAGIWRTSPLIETGWLELVLLGEEFGGEGRQKRFAEIDFGDGLGVAVLSG